MNLLLDRVAARSLYQWVQLKMDEPMPMRQQQHCYNTYANATDIDITLSTHSNQKSSCNSPISQFNSNNKDIIRPTSVSPHTTTSDSMLSPATASIDTRRPSTDLTETSHKFDLFADYDLVSLVITTAQQQQRERGGAVYSPRKCPWPNCNHISSRKRDLGRHAKTHIKDSSPRYVCPSCNKNFSRRDVMMRHQKKTCKG